jgi:hypothetical protein
VGGVEALQLIFPDNNGANEDQNENADISNSDSPAYGIGE